MAIITDVFKDGFYYVWIALVGNSISHYEKLGYDVKKRIDKQGRLSTPRGTKILVRACDLEVSSAVKVTKICDSPNCEIKGGRKILNQTYDNVLRKRISSGIDLCRKCSAQKGAKTREYNIELEKCLFATDPNFIKCLKYPQRGYNLTYGSSKRDDFICINCGYELNNKVIGSMLVHFRLYENIPCPRCSDGISYPEKFITSMFSQTSHLYETQKIFDWSVGVAHTNEKLRGDKRFDGYLPEFKTIIEIHGIQHYDNKFEKLSNRTFHEELENDKIKKSLSENNNESYIVIDCRKSEMEYIKSSVLKSELSQLIDVSKINFLKCHEDACSSLVKVSCCLWNNGLKSTKLISEKIKTSDVTVRKYLKQGVKLNWCDYDPKKESIKFYGSGAKYLKKPVLRLNAEGRYIDEFESISDASRKLNLQISGISMVCTGKQERTGGFKWMYKEDYEKYIEAVV